MERKGGKELVTERGELVTERGELVAERGDYNMNGFI